MIPQFGHIKAGRGKSKVHLFYFKSFNTLFVSLLGGKAHIGAVTAGIGFHSKKISKTLSLPGHKDNVITKKVESILSKHYKGPHLITAGIHYDDITKAQINSIIKNSERLSRQLIHLIQS